MREESDAPGPLVQVLLDSSAQFREMIHEVEGGGGAEEQSRLQQVLVKAVAASAQRRGAVAPHAVGDVNVAAQQPVAAAVLQQGSECHVRKRRIRVCVGEAAQRAELEEKRACGGSGSVVALSRNNAAPQVEAAVGNTGGGHKCFSKRFAQLRCLPQ
jgi:hypothetical protein